jgi:predicted transposase YbfD/YdcC
MQIFLTAFDEVPDPRAGNARHDLAELLVVAFVSVLCGATSCAEMAAFGRAKEHVFRDFLKLRHAIPSHDTFSAVFRVIEPKALDAAFGRVLAEIASLLSEGDVIAIDGKVLRGSRDRAKAGRTRMMVSAYAARLRLTLASVPAEKGAELEAALEVPGLIALKGKVVTADALHCNRRTVAAINARGGDWCLALKANQDPLLSDARSCFGRLASDHPTARQEETGHGRRETRTATAVSARGLAEHHDFPGLKAFGRIEAIRESIRVRRAVCTRLVSCHSLLSRRSVLVRMRSLRIAATRASLAGFPAARRRVERAARSRFLRIAVRAGMVSARRRGRLPPCMVAFPRQVPLSRVTGASPARAAIWRASSWPGSGASARSVAAARCRDAGQALQDAGLVWPGPGSAAIRAAIAASIRAISASMAARRRRAGRRGAARAQHAPRRDRHPPRGLPPAPCGRRPGP